MGLIKKYNSQSWKLAYYPQNDPVQGLSEVDNILLDSKLKNSFNETSLDLTNSLPLGGPINVPNNGHSQEYLPTNTFVLSPEGQVMGDGELQTTFNKTSLDLENPLPLGGAINVAYTAKVGREIITSPTTQPYTPKSTYTDSLTDPRLIARTIDPQK
tara:strand:- start:21 stop:491 length:471 start_codon:yes stop_codon:yes gene_type:complete